MAIISKVLSLPSATNYNPIPVDVNYVTSTYRQYGYSPEAYIEWEQSDTTFYKNSETSVSRINVFDVNQNTVIQSWKTTDFSSPRYLGTVFSIGSNANPREYRVYGSTTANGITIEESVKYSYYPQTAPYTAPTPSINISPYGNFSTSWTNFANDSTNFSWGGAPTADRKYLLQLLYNGNSFVDFYPVSSTSTARSISIPNAPFGNYTWRLTAVNNSGFGTSATSSSQYYSGPYIPPYFCIQADTPIMTWLDSKIVYKKAKDLALGDKLVSYSFEELPKYESTYDVSTWSSESLTPIKYESADVVSIKQHKKDTTVYFNNNLDTRMSIDHSVFIKRNGETFIANAGTIEIGDTIFEIDNKDLTIFENKIISINVIEEETDVFEIDCNPYDVFFAGNMLTHNFKPPY